MFFFRGSIYLLFIFISGISYSQTITVKQDGTGQFTQIQAAIDVAWPGDTVLVYPGRYYENLNYNGKNIVIGSLNMTTADPSYINSTIIDGNQNGSCVQFASGETNARIYGFTIENGSGTYISDLYTVGGGIFIWKDCNLDIINCIIQNNTADQYGGGIVAKKAVVYLSGTTIRNNHSHDSGGGISSTYYNTLIFDTVNLCSIYNNYAIAGADIYKGIYCEPLHFKLDTFTVAKPDHYFLFSANGYMYYSGNDIICDMQHALIEQVCGDLYVSPEGDDNNNGTSPEAPLQHIWYALIKSLPDSNEMHNIYLSLGTWTPSMGERFPVCPRSFTEITGYHRDSCIFDAEQQTYHLHSSLQNNHFAVRNLTLTGGLGDISYFTLGRGSIVFNGSNDFTLENLLITNNKGVNGSVGGASRCGGAVFKNLIFENNVGGRAFTISTTPFNNVIPYERDTSSFINCKFNNNTPDNTTPEFSGGSLTLRGQYHPDYEGYTVNKLFNCEFTNNHNQLSIGNSPNITIIDNSYNYLFNCTIGNNTSENPNGAEMVVSSDSKLYLYNSILHNNQPREMYINSNPNYWQWDTTEVYIYNSLIDGGEERIEVTSSQSKLFYGPNNIDTIPMWDTASQQFPFSLHGNSPCVDAGTLDIPDWIEIPETDLAGNPRIIGDGIDMGAYEYDPGVFTDDKLVTNIPMMRVFPNPITEKLFIEYKTQNKGHILIQVYDIRGILVQTLINMETYPGKGQIVWNGKNDNGNMSLPGTYFISLILDNNEIETVKVVKH